MAIDISDDTCRFPLLWPCHKIPKLFGEWSSVCDIAPTPVARHGETRAPGQLQITVQWGYCMRFWSKSQRGLLLGAGTRFNQGFFNFVGECFHPARCLKSRGGSLWAAMASDQVCFCLPHWLTPKIRVRLAPFRPFQVLYSGLKHPPRNSKTLKACDSFRRIPESKMEGHPKRIQKGYTTFNITWGAETNKMQGSCRCQFERVPVDGGRGWVRTELESDEMKSNALIRRSAGTDRVATRASLMVGLWEGGGPAQILEN